MKKGMVSLLVAVLLVAIPSWAAETRSAVVAPGLSFNGTIATCVIQVEADYESDRIEVYAELCEGSTVVASWNEAEMEYVDVSYRVSVTRGKTYTLRIYATVNERDLPVAYITRKCP